jgi:hypothetical protein
MNYIIYINIVKKWQMVLHGIIWVREMKEIDGMNNYEYGFNGIVIPITSSVF